MTTFAARRASATRPTASVGWAQGDKVAWGTFEVDTLPVALDVYQMCRLPKGAIVTGGTILGDLLASGTSFGSQNLAFNVGVDAACQLPDGTNVTTLSTSTAFGAALKPEQTAQPYKTEVGINHPLGGLLQSAGPVRVTDEATVSLICTSAPTLGSFSTGTLTLVVRYYCETD